jgi:hypothetical protein
VLPTDLTVSAVVEQDGRYLIVEERASGVVVVTQPGGHIETDESPEQAVQVKTERWIRYSLHTPRDRPTGRAVFQRFRVGDPSWRPPASLRGVITRCTRRAFEQLAPSPRRRD